MKGCDVVKFAFITNTVYDIHFITTLENNYIDIVCYIINKEKSTVVGHTNAKVFTEDRGTQENKMCCLIYFYFITVMRERIASLIPRNGNRKRMHANQNDVNNFKNYYDI